MSLRNGAQVFWFCFHALVPLTHATSTNFVMAGFWIVLSTKWDLETVQAGLNVTMTAFGYIGLWAFGRFCRQHVSTKIVNQRAARLSELLTVPTLGTVWDVLALYKSKIFALSSGMLLFQCIVVIIFTALTLVSGVIAKVSLQRGSQILNSTVPGLLTNAHGSGYMTNAITANVVWNLTHQALDRAQFPLDQLLDFVPDSSIPWVYQSEQWNSSWSLSCNSTDRISIDIGSPGDTVTSLRNLFGLFPRAQDFFSEKYRNNSHYRLSTSACGSIDVQKSLMREIVYYVLFSSEPSIDDNMYKNENQLDFSLGAFGVQQVEFVNYTGSTMSARAAAPPSETLFSRVDCSVARSRPVPDANFTAWPWTNDTQSLIQAYADYHRWNSIAAYLARNSTFMTTAEEMIRFYQVYTIMKDTWEFSAPVQRTIAVTYSTIELSSICLAVLAAAWLAALIGSVRYSVFWLRKRSKLELIPDSALDWMIWASNTEDRSSSSNDNKRLRRFSRASYELNCEIGVPFGKETARKVISNSFCSLSKIESEASSSAFTSPIDEVIEDKKLSAGVNDERGMPDISFLHSEDDQTAIGTSLEEQINDVFGKYASNQ